MIGLILCGAAVIAAGVYFGWQAAAICAVAVVGAYMCGYDVALSAIRREGYVVQRTADMTGRKRWRVGVAEREAVVEWLKPGESTR